MSDTTNIVMGARLQHSRQRAGVVRTQVHTHTAPKAKPPVALTPPEDEKKHQNWNEKKMEESIDVVPNILFWSASCNPPDIA